MQFLHRLTFVANDIVLYLIVIIIICLSCRRSIKFQMSLIFYILLFIFLIIINNKSHSKNDKEQARVEN